MGKLTNLKPRLSSLPARVSTVIGEERARDQPWRKWYSTQRWRDLRMLTFLRDGFICQRTGVPVRGKYPAPDSPVANHKRPHRGNPKLFWDPNNIETVSKAVHDRQIQREEQGIPQGIWD